MARRVLCWTLLAALGAGCAAVSRYNPDGPTISWRHAAKHYDEFVTIEGTIVRTHNSGKACFLSFHPNWRQTFGAVIFARSFPAFPPKPEDFYRGKKVRLKGLIVQYEGRPEMILDSPDQIEVLP
ncbi:MAG: hypothetical protein FJ291_27625 [Planctomycetes bacterium]|nr:hypothetical protein [Planctomycetota bacterium]